MFTRVSALTLVLRLNAFSLIDEDDDNNDVLAPTVADTSSSSSSICDPLFDGSTTTGNGVNNDGNDDADVHNGNGIEPTKARNGSQRHKSDSLNERHVQNRSFISVLLRIIYDLFHRLESQQTKLFIMQYLIIIVFVPILSFVYIVLFILLLFGITPKFLVIIDTTKCLSVKLSKIHINKFLFNTLMINKST